VDYDIDYLQGRVLLSQPLSSTANDNLLVRTSGLSGDEAFWLCVTSTRQVSTSWTKLPSAGQGITG